MARWFEKVTRAGLHLVDPYQEAATLHTPPKRVWPYMRMHLRPLRWVLSLSLIATILTASIEVWLISFAGQLIDMLADTSPDQIWQEHGLTLLGAAIAVLVLRPILRMARHIFNDIGLDCNIANLVRWRAHGHLAAQSVGWFQNDLAGRTSIRLIEMGNYTASVVFNTLNTVAFGLVYMVGIVILMAGTDPRLALPILLWMLGYAAIMRWMIPRMIAAQERFQGSKSALVGKVVDSFSNFDTLKLFARKDAIEQDHLDALETTRETLFKARQLGVTIRTAIVTLEGFIMVCFIGYGIWLWSSGAASIGIVSSAIALTFRVTSLAEWMLDAIWSIFLGIGSMREGLKTLSQPLAIPSQPDAPDLVIKGGAITMTNLTHLYGGQLGGVDGVDLQISPGEKVGLVGQSGAGKSTLVNLILRFFDAESGEILIDGQNIRDVDQDSLRSAIGMVSQQAALLNRSVGDNIALGAPDISQQKMEAAAREAAAHDFITQLQDQAGRQGYAAHVGERGVKLSGGQRQRIALARVILKDAPILILDEATSALDSEVEAEIQATLGDVMRDKTVIAIAHRLSTIAQMDRIIVLDRGRIVEQGNHATLLAQGGLYASYWKHQSGGFLGTDDPA
ncbi:ABC transporter ATP-binding protein [Yoonia sp. BS5-3]|uniref:ABC transporter ATP-binding protein n=1 Tax=Yoonia phaeophyticola TaxID=3137369 RepID=A0ABZ2V3R2_9RHOB